MQKPNTFFYYSNNFPSILQEIGSTLAYTTYQAGKLILVSSPNGNGLVKYAKNFKRPMGIAYDKSSKKLAVASKSVIDIFSSSESLSLAFPPAQGKFDHVFLPQAKYFTGYLDTHELIWFGKELWSVNTMFSCLATMDHSRHFVPKWQPGFITELLPEDRCHINGLAVENGEAAYVSLFDETNSKEGWRNDRYDTGKIIDIRTNKTVLDGLAMPHSPSVDGDYIYFLQSAIGEINRYNKKTGEVEKLNSFKTFVRGLEIIDDYIFVGASCIRENSRSFQNLPIKAGDSFCGILVLNKHTGEHIGGLTYTDMITELFAVKIMPGVKSPAILTDKDDWHDKAVHAGEHINYWMREKEKSEPLNQTV